MIHQQQQQPAAPHPATVSHHHADDLGAYRTSSYEGLQAANESGLHPTPDHQASHYRPTPLAAGGQDGSTEKAGGAYSVVSPFSAAATMVQPATATTVHDSPELYQGPHPSSASRNNYSYSPTSQPPPPPPSEPSSSTPLADGRETNILGLRRTTFFLVASNVLLAIGLILVGVLVSRNSNSAATCPSGSNALQGTATSTGPAVQTGTVSPNAVCFSTSSIPAGTRLGTPTVDCPRPQNLTRYAVPNTGLTFERACGIDYTGNDLGRFPVVSMLDCLHLCAQLNLFPSSAVGRCVGVSWVFGDGPQGLGVGYCYPKSNTTSVTARGDTESATLVLS